MLLTPLFPLTMYYVHSVFMNLDVHCLWYARTYVYMHVLNVYHSILLLPPLSRKPTANQRSNEIAIVWWFQYNTALFLKNISNMYTFFLIIFLNNFWHYYFGKYDFSLKAGGKCYFNAWLTKHTLSPASIRPNQNKTPQICSKFVIEIWSASLHLYFIF